MSAPSCILLDGGTATTLELAGANIDGKLWSAQLLLDQPNLVRQMHTDFYKSGSVIGSTVSYQASLPGFADVGISPAKGLELIADSVKLAREAATDTAGDCGGGKKFVAGSCGPYGAALCNGGEYTGEYAVKGGDPVQEKQPTTTPFTRSKTSVFPLQTSNVTIQQMKEFHWPRISELVAAGVDCIALETIPCLTEVIAVCELMATEFPTTPFWLSVRAGTPTTLASGESLQVAVETAEQLAAGQLLAFGVNCIPPSLVIPCVETIRSAKLPTEPADCSVDTLSPLLSVTELSSLIECIQSGSCKRYTRRVAVYPNSGEGWDAENRQWVGNAEQDGCIGDKAVEWWRAGASFIGGCCRTPPQAITKVHAALLHKTKGVHL